MNDGAQKENDNIVDVYLNGDFNLKKSVPTPEEVSLLRKITYAQRTAWINRELRSGRSVHNVVDEECNADFSCCQFVWKEKT